MQLNTTAGRGFKGPASAFARSSLARSDCGRAGDARRPQQLCRHPRTRRRCAVENTTFFAMFNGNPTLLQDNLAVRDRAAQRADDDPSVELIPPVVSLMAAAMPRSGLRPTPGSSSPLRSGGVHRLPIPCRAPSRGGSFSAGPVGNIAGTTTRLRDRRGPHRIAEFAEHNPVAPLVRRPAGKVSGLPSDARLRRPRLMASPPIPRGRTALSGDIYVPYLR